MNDGAVAGEARRLRSILLAIPIAGPSLELHRFVVERFLEFGEAGGLDVWWRPISSTTLADPIYKQLRSPELARRDHNEARKYLHYCRKAGGEDDYVRGEYLKLAYEYEVWNDQRPALILLPKPLCGKFATLQLAPAAFETEERQRTLACFLYEELGEARVRRFMRGGVFDAGSVAKLQAHVDSIAAFVAKSVARDRGVPQRFWNSYLAQMGLVERPNPGERTTARAWRRSGSLFLQTETGGTLDGKVEFPLQEGRITLQMQLMWRLLLAWPKGFTFEEVAKDLYQNEFDAALRGNDRHRLRLVAKCVRSLIHDIRCDKLEPAGINPEILPTVLTAKGSNHSVRLRFADLNRLQLGHMSRHQF